MAEQDVRKIEFAFKTHPDYRIVSANGVWGGITTRGDLKMDFLVEYRATPHKVTNVIGSDSKVGDEISREPEDIREGKPVVVTRELQCGVLLSIEHAETIANWMLEKVKLAKT